MRNQNIALLGRLVVTGALALSTTAAQAAEKELLDILLGNGAITQEQYDVLLEKEELEQIDVADINFSEGSGLNITSGDGNFEVEIGGRLHLDTPITTMIREWASDLSAALRSDAVALRSMVRSARIGVCF